MILFLKYKNFILTKLRLSCIILRDYSNNVNIEKVKLIKKLIYWYRIGLFYINQPLNTYNSKKNFKYFFVYTGLQAVIKTGLRILPWNISVINKIRLKK